MDSLQDIIIKYIANNPRLIKKMCLYYLQYRYGDLPVDASLIIPILRSLGSFLTPEIMRTFEYVCPSLPEEDTIDDEYWRIWVLRNFQSRLILFPFPVLVNYVHELKRLIMLNANDDAKLLSYIDILKKIPFSIELARVTDIGYTVNSLGKHSTFKIVSDAARDLTKKWKAIYERLQATSSSSENTSLDCPTPSNHSHDVNRDSPNITTWRSLYTYCEEETTNIFHVASSKVSQLATNIKASQRGTCTNYSAQQETDEKKKRRLQARLNELKIPTKKPRNMNPSNVEPPKVKMVAIVPLHEQKIKR